MLPRDMALPGVYRIELAVAACLCLTFACSSTLSTNGDGGAGGTGSVVGGGGASGPAGGGGPAGGQGTGESCLPMLPFDQCGAALCGNQTRDTCEVRSGLGFCPLVSLTEECDGADLAGRTCEALGYGSGALACSATCRIDSRGCSECLPPSASLLRCGAAPVAADPLALAIAASDDEVALTWIERSGVERPELRLARLSPSLDVVSTSSIAEPALAALPVGAESSYFAVAAARLPSGWAIAGYAPPAFFLHAVDGSGQSVARTLLDTAPLANVFAFPVLAGRPDGGPLVLWQTSTGLRAVVVAADGRSTTAPVMLPVTGRLADYPRVAFVGGVFYVLAPLTTSTSSPLLRMFRIGSDGTLASTFDALPGVSAARVSLVSDADDLRIVYDDGGRIVWRKLGPTGAPLTSPVVIGSGTDFGGAARPIGFGADTVALLVGANAANAIGITRIGPDGQVVTAAHKIGTGPSIPFSSYDIVRRGPDAVAVWLGFSPGIRLARVAP